MTERAQKIMDIFYEKYPDLNRYYIDKECIASVLREVVLQLQYYHFGDGEDMVVNSRDILDIADELEMI